MTVQILYLAGSLAGIGLMVGLCVMLFGRGVATLDAATAEARLKDDVPGFRAGDIALSSDTRAALVQDARDGGIWLVAVRGDGFVTRRLARDSLKSKQRSGASLDFRFSDFTFPKAAMAFADEAVARDWDARLAAV